MRLGGLDWEQAVDEPRNNLVSGTLSVRGIVDAKKLAAKSVQI